MNWNGIISLLVACIELILAVNILVFAEKNKENTIASLIVAVLFIYQIFEFLMCHFSMGSSAMAYTAFVDISFLPPLSLYFTLLLLNNAAVKYYKFFFIPALFFIIYYVFTISEFAVVSCTVLYASYNYPLGTLYGIFYYLPLLIAMVTLITFIIKEKSGKKVFLSKVLLSGYIIVFLPVIIAFVLAASGQKFLLDAIESIMCKFAVVIAFCISFIAIYNRNNLKSDVK